MASDVILSFLFFNVFILGSFISFSTFGSDQNNVQVYAENYINVERTLRSLNYLVRNTMCIFTHLCSNDPL